MLKCNALVVLNFNIYSVSVYLHRINVAAVKKEKRAHRKQGVLGGVIEHITRRECVKGWVWHNANKTMLEYTTLDTPTQSSVAFQLTTLLESLGSLFDVYLGKLNKSRILFIFTTE